MFTAGVPIAAADLKSLVVAQDGPKFLVVLLGGSY